MSGLIKQLKESGISLLQRTATTEHKGLFSKVIRKGALATVNRLVGAAIPFAARNQFEVVELKRGYLKAKIPLKGNQNHIGTMYAGALFTLAELPGGIISIFHFDPTYYPILKELKMTYQKVAKSDVTVEFSLSEHEVSRIEKEASEHGKSPFTLHGKLIDNQGNIVAESEAHYQVRKQL
ncbi:PaaI family thioesterase [Alkalimarinus sediminis]|uniref:DUF4442 domain-containing protein n=1 Tax=Alkalimarinus sediminis TaxID=1632866 RepID=A0A9E8HJD0_9ALTE|nr:YiiD C-terminal domain-containing protein [Alkalimarinus sediminis]UZW75763.1 DUF4442 domain-containing protein [Alkalimarinus sediminis]